MALDLVMIYINNCAICHHRSLTNSSPGACTICEEPLDTRPARIGVLGLTHIGLAIVNGFKSDAEIKAWDANSTRSLNTLDQTLDSDFIFVCVPAPVHQPGMGADLSQVHAVLASAKAHHDKFKSQAIGPGGRPVYILKTTVPVGTTDTLIQTTGLNMVCSPSFLSPRMANFEFLTTTNTIIGADDPQSGNLVSTLFQLRFPVAIYRTTARHAEFTKHMISCFLATKVALLNEFNLLAEQLGIDWNQLLPGFLSDGRIAQSDYCLEDLGTYDQDLCGFRHTMRECGINPQILDAVWAQSEHIRERS